MVESMKKARIARLAPRSIMLLFSTVYFVSYLTRINYAAVISVIIAEEGIQATLASVAVTGAFITYGIGRRRAGNIALFAGRRTDARDQLSANLHAAAADGRCSASRFLHRCLQRLRIYRQCPVDICVCTSVRNVRLERHGSCLVRDGGAGALLCLLLSLRREETA